MEHPLLQPYASHPGPWSSYVDYAEDPHIAVHHVNSESQSYQHQQYTHFHQQTYVIAQNDVSQHPPLATPDAASMPYWPTAQVPGTTADTSLSTALSMEPTYYPASCYDNQDLSSTHCHTVRDDHILHGLPGACGGVTYGTTNLAYAESDTPATVPPALAPHPTIAHQTESGHVLIQWDPTVVGSALYEGGGATAFQTTDTSYTPAVRPYEASYTTATPSQPHYTPEPAKVERQQTYIATSAPAPAPDGQNQYVAPVPVSAPVPAVRSTKREVQSPDLPPRGKSPMGHLPYPEDIGIKAEGRCRDVSLHRAITQLPSPAPTRSRSPTPTPLSPYLQTLTFITYPETEPRGHREGRNGGSGVGGNGGADSDELDEEDEESSSPPRRGRRGKKEPKKDPFLACFFCRGRKIACHPRNDAGDRTCTQCAKRHIRCQFPLTSRRGQRKPRESAAGDCDSTALWGSSTSCSPTPPSTRTNSKPRARASSRRPTSSSLIRAA